MILDKLIERERTDEALQVAIARAVKVAQKAEPKAYHTPLGKFRVKMDALIDKLREIRNDGC